MARRGASAAVIASLPPMGAGVLGDLVAVIATGRRSRWFGSSRSNCPAAARTKLASTDWQTSIESKWRAARGRRAQPDFRRTAGSYCRTNSSAAAVTGDAADEVGEWVGVRHVRPFQVSGVWQSQDAPSVTGGRQQVPSIWSECQVVARPGSVHSCSRFCVYESGFQNAPARRDRPTPARHRSKRDRLAYRVVASILARPKSVILGMREEVSRETRSAAGRRGGQSCLRSLRSARNLCLQQHVRGFEVAVDQPALVAVLQRARPAASDAGHRYRERPRRRHESGEIDSLTCSMTK
jgi:hypothetical protein